MPDPNRVFEKNINRKDTNFLLYFNILIAFAGSIFLAWNEVSAGLTYTIMFLAGIAILFLTFLFLKDDDTLRPITDYIRIPFGTNLALACLFYLLGQLTPAVVKIVLWMVGSTFDSIGFAVPLFGADISNIQSFSAAQISESTPWKLFNLFFTAGTIETFIYNFVAVVAGVLVGYFTLQLLNDGKDLGIMKKKTFVLLFGFGISTLFFVLSHVLNDTYTFTMFIIAAVFLLVSNMSIYLGGMFLLYWMGYHQMNNLLWLTFDPKYGLGAGEVAQGFLSWFGLIFIVYELLIIWYLLRNSKKVGEGFKAWFRS